MVEHRALGRGPATGRSAKKGAGWHLASFSVPPVHPQAQANPSSLPCERRLEIFWVMSAHFSVMQDLIIFDEEALGLMAPLNVYSKVSAKRPSNPPQPPHLLTFVLPLAPYFVPPSRLWQSTFSRAKYYV